MRVFDSATEHIKQGGRRRGANMGVLRVDHPDILEFVDAKLDGEPVAGTRPDRGGQPLRRGTAAAVGELHSRLDQPGPRRHQRAHGAAVDWERLRSLVHTGVRFLDDAIEVNRDPLPPVAAATRAGRKIGLGVMASPRA